MKPISSTRSGPSRSSKMERGVSRLSIAAEAAVRRMKEFAEGIKTSVPAIKVVGTKRKKNRNPRLVPQERAKAERDREALGPDLSVLQRVNRMSLTELLNPDNERDTEQATVQDIYDAVSAARLAQDNSDANGGDDDEDDDADITVRPSRREALAAVATLQNFTATMNDDFSRKLDAVLARFGRQTQLEETNQKRSVPITDFFRPQE
ncbi:hypothetical protein C8R46DRAFT_1314063 [Mycena filopes]|nr:hypothetical protein C8R46DRAFT_1314063 [Mycena filopes]